MAMNKTTSAGMTPEMKTFYDRVLLERMLPNLGFVKHGKKKPIPKNGGKEIEFRKFQSLSLATTPLTEGEPPTPENLTVATLTASVKQYGAVVEVSDVLDQTAIDPVITETVELQGEQAGETLDVIARDILASGTAVYNIGGGVSVNNITSADVLTTKDLLRLWAMFKRNNVKPFEGGYYLMFCSPEQCADIMNDPLWKDVSTYNNGGKNIEKNEIGRCRGFRFIDTTLIEPKDNTASVTVYSGIAIGKDAYGIVDIENGSKPKSIIKIASDDDSDRSDPLNQKSTIGWKALFTAVRLYELAIIRVNSASEF